MQLPVVNFKNPNAALLFCNSLRETGFAVLRNHPLERDLVDAIYREWLDFFHANDKYRYAYDPSQFDGYFSTDVSETAKNHTHKDLKEFFHIYPWGRYPSEVSDAAQRYYKQGATLAGTLLQWVQAYSPADVKARYSMPLPDMINGSGQTLLRVLHYPPLSGREAPGSLRAAAHGDINLLTILPAANEPGLQVMGKDQAWHDVPCDFGLLIVNTGDMLAEASGQHYPSTVHRVLNPSGEAAHRSRISLPLFLHPRPDVVLSQRHTADSYLKERLGELRGDTR